MSESVKLGDMVVSDLKWYVYDGVWKIVGEDIVEGQEAWVLKRINEMDCDNEIGVYKTSQAGQSLRKATDEEIEDYKEYVVKRKMLDQIEDAIEWFGCQLDMDMVSGIHSTLTTNPEVKKYLKEGEMYERGESERS